ncbi:hypothetical protein QZH41_016739, partial [Actinostola sp. cb2023]
EFNDTRDNINKAMSQEDVRALQVMEETAKLVNGYYEVALPWRVYPPNLSNNKVLAERRLAMLKKRLTKDEELHRKYSEFMQTLSGKGYAQKVPEDQLNRTELPAWYLPHHPVIHPHKPGKVRVVFDCAAKFQGTSINERLMQGPDFTNTLVGVMTRFRKEQTAVMADIESMFYQDSYLRFYFLQRNFYKIDAEEVWIGTTNYHKKIETRVSTQLHNFADASQKGYGAVSYLRVVNSKGEIHCTFMMGKSRLAPMKAVTIPRLELSVAVVATRLGNMINQELDIDIDETFYWTDSTCVLGYILNQEKRFHVFIANRIAAIHNGSQQHQWRHVDTNQNPADEASRGLSANDLITSQRWINGPGFLWQEETEWPKQPETQGRVKDDDPE